MSTNTAFCCCDAPKQPEYKPLHHAAWWGKPLCVGLLLAADDSALTLKDGGETPADKARKNGSPGIAAALEQWRGGDHEGAQAALQKLNDVARELWEAVVRGKVEDVTRTAPLAAAAGVIDKVTMRQRQRRGMMARLT